MNTKIRKLFGLAACCCSLFCVSASADWTLEEVLVEINRTYGYKDIIEERDLEKYGVLETAKEILREENERADREIDIVSKCWKAYKQACLASLSRPGFLTY